MRVFYNDCFVLPLPPGHRFPMRKYALLCERVAESGVVRDGDLCVPRAAKDEEILRAHDADYLDRVKHGTLAPQEVRRIGFPWSPPLVERARRSCGATIEACRAALDDGVAVSLAGGTHHAFRDHGEAYCVVNDTVVAARAVQAEGRARRVVVIDCDVHQGNGTASITADDPTIFTFSIHGAHNYPFRKEQSDLDVALPDGTEDARYLEELERGLWEALRRADANLAIYVSGADPYVDDTLGRLALSKAGLAQRDRLVLSSCARAGVPVAVTMAGGYARRVEDVVDIHLATVRAAVEAQPGAR